MGVGGGPERRSLGSCLMLQGKRGPGNPGQKRSERARLTAPGGAAVEFWRSLSQTERSPAKPALPAGGDGGPPRLPYPFPRLHFLISIRLARRYDWR